MPLPARITALASRLVLAVVSAFALTAGTVPRFESDAQTIQPALASSFANLRSAPATTSRIEVIVPPSAALTVNGEVQGGFAPVIYGEHAGWVARHLLQMEMRTGPVAAAGLGRDVRLSEGAATVVESVNLRSGPGRDFDAIVVIDAGTQVEATGEIDGAYEKIIVGGREGWVRSIYVDRGPESRSDLLRQAEAHALAASAGRPLVVPGTDVMTDAEIVLRGGPSANTTKLAVVPVDSKLTLTGTQDGEFVEVIFDGKTGWVASAYVRQAVPRADGPMAVPVLMYHSIQEHGAAYQVTAAQLEEQLSWLSQKGYESITSADLLNWLTYGVPLPELPVMITIDDGNASDWQFLELLERYGFEGVFALPNYAQLTAGQIRTLDRAGEVCGHTVSHQNLSTLSYDEQYYEIVENKNYLQAILGNEITCFAYPFGAYNGLTPYVVIEAGYHLAFDVSGGPQPLDTSIDRWHIVRINVNGSGTLDDFIASLEY